METKPAIYTTEFWVTLLTASYLFLNAVDIVDQIPKTWAAISMAIIVGLYTIGRGIAKNKGSVDPHYQGNYKLIPRYKDRR